MSKARVLLFAFVLSLACASLLGLARNFTAAQIARNELLDEMRSILDAAGWQDPRGRGLLQVPSVELEAVFRQQVQKPEAADPFRGPFTYSDAGGQVRAQVLRLRGKGLWGDMYGFLALSPEPRPDGKLQVRGLTFYKEEETPGLGKRIHESKFRGQFAPEQGRLVPGLRVQKGEGNPSGPQQVDGVTSASVTSAGVEGMIEEAARWYLDTWLARAGGAR
jgi:Na+-transporting NADH:ubiquinone oxidoreductase subunit NqrC